MSLQPFLINPVLIDPTSTTVKGFIGGEAGSGGLAATYPPFLYNGALYQVLQGAGLVSRFTPQGGIFVYRSLDGGNTWAALDAANGPSRVDANPTAGFFYDQLNKRVVVAWCPNGGPIFGSPGQLELQNFNLQTGTWGPIYAAAGAPTIYTVEQAFVRPDGSIAVIACPNLSGGFVANPTAYIWNGAAWSSFALDTNVTGGYSAGDNDAACMDLAGNLHVFMIAHNAGTARVFYQLFTAANALGASAIIQTGTPNLPGIGGEFQPCISGDNVIIGLVDDTGNFATVAVGTPLSAPVFTRLASPGVDPILPAGFFRIGAAKMAADATGIYAAYVIQSAADFSISMRLCFSPNISAPLTGWNTSILAFDADNTLIGDPTGWDFLGIARVSGNTFASANTVITTGGGEPTQYWLGTLGGGSFSITLRGVNRFQAGQVAPIEPPTVVTVVPYSPLPVRMK